MAYTALSNIVNSTIASELGADAVFATLVSAQYLEMFNTSQEKISGLYCAVSKPDYQVGVYNAAVSTGTQSAIGQYGYVATIDMTTSTPKQILQVSMQKVTSGVMSLPSTTPDTLANIFSYPQNSAPPTFAFLQIGNSLVLFLQTSTYPFTTDSVVHTILYRDTIALAAPTDKLDIPEEARALFNYYALQEAYTSSGTRLPAYISDGIQREKTNLGLISNSQNTTSFS